MKFSSIFLLPVIVICVAGNPIPQATLQSEDLQWLMGDWQGEFDGAQISESWKKNNDGLYTGDGFVFGGKDTFVREELRIERIANYWAFIPVINSKHPVLFTLVKNENHTLVFENKEHDFPQRVAYSYEDGKLHAWIEGMQGKKQVKEDYWYERK